MSIAHAPAAPAVSETEIDRRTAFADAALGAAGHQVTDPVLLELGRKVAAGLLTAEEANAQGLAYLDAR